MGVRNIRNAKTWFDTGKGVAILAFGTLAGITSFSALSQYPFAQEAFVTYFTGKSVSHEEALEAFGKGTKEECVQGFKGFSENNTIRKVADAFGGVKELCSLPTVEWKDSFHAGGADYIDGVKPSDLSDPAMRGIDIKGRPFVALHTIGIRGENTYEGVETLFQRSTDDDHVWVSGGHSTPMHFFRPSTHDENFNKLAQLARGEKISLSKYGSGSIHLADK